MKELLQSVQKPARYCGGEYNSVAFFEADKNFLMCFPDLYEVGMSNLGIKLLYHMLNDSGIFCDLCFAPDTDFAEQLKKLNKPLMSLQAKKDFGFFDFVGFSLQYEMSYTNVLYMLDLGGIPFLASARGEQYPIIVGGGPCAVNPMPLYDIFDLFVIGDGEEATLALCELKKKCASKQEFLQKAAALRGVFVPRVSTSCTRALVENLDTAYYPLAPIVPHAEAVHDRAFLEVFRGCTRGCRFCQAGYIYRPVRERKVQTLLDYTKKIIKNTGFEEITLSSLSTCDYSNLREYLEQIREFTQQNRVNLSLPSLRVDSFEAQYVATQRLSSLTFAPEAGTQRLRDVINKNVTEQDILGSCETAFAQGYNKIKLYFMLGLPYEQMQDVEGIVDLCAKIKRTFYASKKGKGLTITVSTSTFIPKPFTPFEREAFAGKQDIEQKQRYLRDTLKKMGIRYSWHDYDTSLLETVFARGDARLSAVLIDAYKMGASFDGWSERFDLQAWNEALKKHNIDVQDYLGFMQGELAWSKIDMGIDAKFLQAEAQLAGQEKVTCDCRKQCHACGMHRLTKCRGEQ